MKIIRFTWLMRNDFKAIYECEHCNDSFEAWGYNDANFHNRVVPNVHCDKCGKKSDGTTLQDGERKYTLDMVNYGNR